MARCKTVGQSSGSEPAGEICPCDTAASGDKTEVVNRKLNSPLQRLHNWPQLAHQARYSVSVLAKSCGVSVRTLERFFLTAFGDTPRCWLKRLRSRKAPELLRDGSSIKETSVCLGYADPSHFSRDFKKHYGFAPNKYANPPAKAAATAKMSHSAMKLSRLAMKA